MPAFVVRAVPIEATVGEEEMRFADRRFGFRIAAQTGCLHTDDRVIGFVNRHRKRADDLRLAGPKSTPVIRARFVCLMA